MELIEGQAYIKETNFVDIKKGGFVNTDQTSLVENDEKSATGKNLGGKILAGSVIGSSDFASGHAKKLLERNGFTGQRFVHGAGKR